MPKVVNINIAGQIGSYKDETGKVSKGVDLIDVISQVQKVKDADTVRVSINSPGGLTSTAWDIYDYLLSLKKTIVTVINGQCASSATIIALAGTEREIVKGSTYHPHNPWLPNVSGDAAALAEMSAAVQVEEDRFVEAYHKHTDISKAGISAIMKLDEDMPIEKALELGFVTKIVDPSTDAPLAVVPTDAKIFAMITIKKANPNPQPNIMKEFKAMFTALCAELGIKIKGAEAPKPIELKTADGKTVSIADPDGDGVPAVGDICSLDGAVCGEGSLAMEDGTTIKTGADGAIAEITPAAAATITDDASFVEQIKEALEGTGIEVVTAIEKEKDVTKRRIAIVAALKKVVADNKKSVKSLKDFEVSAIAQLKALKDEIKSNGTPPAKFGDFRTKLDTKNDAEKGTLGAIDNFKNRHKKPEPKK